MARTGVLGGSFNPIHYGHLLLADQVVEILNLDRLVFVPAAAPPHKAAGDLAPAEHRCAMVKLATARHPRLSVSDIEMRRAGPSYTVDTLEELARDGDELYLVMGSETFLDLLSWHAPHRLAALARLVVVPRAGRAFDPAASEAKKIHMTIGAEAIAPVENGVVPARGTLVLHAVSLPLSASDIRDRVRRGRSVAYRLPPDVVAYIEAHRLYRDLRR